MRCIGFDGCASRDPPGILPRRLGEPHVHYQRAFGYLDLAGTCAREGPEGPRYRSTTRATYPGYRDRARAGGSRCSKVARIGGEGRASTKCDHHQRRDDSERHYERQRPRVIVLVPPAPHCMVASYPSPFPNSPTPPLDSVMTTATSRFHDPHRRLSFLV